VTEFARIAQRESASRVADFTDAERPPLTGNRLR
jgi:hypothetical protein